LYHQIVERIRTAVHSKEFKKGDIIGPEKRLAQDFHVSLNTVRRAMEVLVSEGILVRKPGVGTVVADRVGSRPFRIVRHFEPGADQPVCSVLSVREEPHDLIALERLQRTAGERLWCVVRMERIRDVPTAILEDYALSDPGTQDRSWFSSASAEAVIDAAQVRGTVHHEIKALGANTGLARMLRVDAGVPLIVLERMLFDEVGKPAGFGRYSFLASHCEFQFTL
jgi:GntR family transcriptional regulator